MDVTAPPDPQRHCAGVGDILALVGEKWTVQVVVALHVRDRRFNDLRRWIDGISHQMLARTLRILVCDGLAARIVRPTVPPEVEYSLTTLGRSLAEPLHALAEWAATHAAAIGDHRAKAAMGVGEEDMGHP